MLMIATVLFKKMKWIDVSLKQKDRSHMLYQNYSWRYFIDFLRLPLC